MLSTPFPHANKSSAVTGKKFDGQIFLIALPPAQFAVDPALSIPYSEVIFTPPQLSDGEKPQ